MIEKAFQRKLKLIKQMHQKNVIISIIDTLKILVLNMNHIFAIVFNAKSYEF